MRNLIVVGGGLAGCEAAWQAAERGVEVVLYEMRPEKKTGAHQTDNLAEIVCSNSLGSTLPDRPSGLLLNELKVCGSLLASCASKSAIPAGSALAVDRVAFSSLISEKFHAHPRINVLREEIRKIPAGIAVIATGPLTTNEFATDLADFLGKEQLYFFDAISPIVSAASIDMQVAFRASRFNRSTQADGDYINCPMDQGQYQTFVGELCHAKTIKLAENEIEVKKGVTAGHRSFFEGCLPIEVMAARDTNALAYGPLRPIGIYDPTSGKRFFAVTQLRQDDIAATLFNLVGFQTNLTYPEQVRVFRLIPGLEHAEFVRFGQMHRNTFIDSPSLLQPDMRTRARTDLFIAGQLAGIEGYLGNIASGLVAGINAARMARSEPTIEFPPTTMIGALMNYICSTNSRVFQPMKANFGLLPPLEVNLRSKRERNRLYSERALSDLKAFLSMGDVIG